MSAVVRPPRGLTLCHSAAYHTYHGMCKIFKTALSTELTCELCPLTTQGPVVPSMYDVPRFDPNWDPIYLEYKGEWPLGLLITPAHLGEKQPALFKFLWKILLFSQNGNYMQ